MAAARSESRKLPRQKFKRFVHAVLAPVLVSAANFMVSGLLAALVPASEFGLYAFAIVLQVLAYGVSTALFGGTIAIVLNEETGATAADINAFYKLNAMLCAAAALLTGVAVDWLGGGNLRVALFALLAMIAVYRWYLRLHAFAILDARIVAISDSIYAAVVAVGSLMLLGFHSVTVPWATGIMVAGNVLATLAFGRLYVNHLRAGLSQGKARDFAAVWHRFSRWSLLGTVTSELTSNAHSYIIAGYGGPAALAPLAVASLLWRPLGLTMVTLTQSERPLLVGLAAKGDTDEIKRSLGHFRIALTAILIANAIGAVLFLHYAGGTVFGENYDFATLFHASWFMMIISAIRAFRAAESALLQALGSFKFLAITTVVTAGVSISLVVLMLLSFGLVESLAGTAVGELLATLAIFLHARRWLRQHASSAIN